MFSCFITDYREVVLIISDESRPTSLPTRLVGIAIMLKGHSPWSYPLLRLRYPYSVTFLLSLSVAKSIFTLIRFYLANIINSTRQYTGRRNRLPGFPIWTSYKKNKLCYLASILTSNWCASRHVTIRRFAHLLFILTHAQPLRPLKNDVYKKSVN